MSKKPKVKTTAKPKPKAKAPAKKAKRAPPKLRHDTPLDLPMVGNPHDTLETPEVNAAANEAMTLAFDPERAVEQALARVRRIESIKGAYEAWLDLRLEHSAALLKLTQERQRLEQEGEFLVGAVRAARDLGRTPSIQEALTLASEGKGLDSFLVTAAGQLQSAKAQLSDKTRVVEEAFGHAFAEIREELRSRIKRTLKHVRPRMKLIIRALNAEQRILHLARLQPDEAVLLAWVLLEKLPSRYDFLFDDSTDDATLAPPMLYAEEGISSGHTRPTAPQVQALIEREGQVVPIKGVVPFFIPRRSGGPQLIRLVERGPVMEAEISDGDLFRNVLSRDEAERIAGFFLRLKLEDKLEIELSNS